MKSLWIKNLYDVCIWIREWRFIRKGITLQTTSTASCSWTTCEFNKRGGLTKETQINWFLFIDFSEVYLAMRHLHLGQHHRALKCQPHRGPSLETQLKKHKYLIFYKNLSNKKMNWMECILLCARSSADLPLPAVPAFGPAFLNMGAFFSMSGSIKKRIFDPRI